jgi:hypothetical protein
MIRPQAVAAGLLSLSASFHKYGDVCGKRDGVEFATKKSVASRRHPSG